MPVVRGKNIETLYSPEVIAARNIELAEQIVQGATNESSGVGSLARWMLPVALLLVFGLIAIQVTELANGRRIAVRGQGQPVRAD